MSGLNSQLIKDLVRFEFICKAHINLNTKPINKKKVQLVFYQALLFISMNNCFLLEFDSFIKQV